MSTEVDQHYRMIVDVSGETFLAGRVSHICDYKKLTERKESDERLKKWQEEFQRENPDLPLDYYAQRGTLLHEACEFFLKHRQSPKEIHPWISSLWPQALPILSAIAQTYWSEKPFDNPVIDWNGLGIDFTFQDKDGETRHHIWHPDGFCGTPDLLVHYKGMVTLPDWKTSRIPYAKRVTNPKNWQQRKGYYKFAKCARQISAYVHAFEYLLGKPGWIQQGCVNVLVENGSSQVLTINRMEIEQHYGKFKERLSWFKEDMGLI